MDNEKIIYRYVDKDLVTNLLNSDEDTIYNLGMKVTLLENLVKQDIAKYSTERAKRECIEIYSNVINELRKIIYEYNISHGIDITEGVYQDSVKPKLQYENKLITGMEYMRTMFPPLDKNILVNYLHNYTRALCKHRREDRYCEELWFKIKMCLKYLDGILFSSDASKYETNYNAMTLGNYLEFMLNEDLPKDDASRYVRYLKRYKPKYEQKPMERVETLFKDNKTLRVDKPSIELKDSDSIKPYKDNIQESIPTREEMNPRNFGNMYEMNTDKNIVPPPKKLDGFTSVIFIIIAIIILILLFYYMV